MDDAQVKMILQALQENRASIEKLSDKLDGNLAEVYERQTKIRIDVGKLKVKAGVWGLLGSFIGLVTAYAALMFKKIGG